MKKKKRLMADLNGQKTHSSIKKNARQIIRKDYTYYNEYHFSIGQIVKCALFVIGILLVASFVFYDSLWPTIILFAPALFVFLKRQKKCLICRRKKSFQKQFLSAGALLSTYLKSGQSIERAIESSQHDLIEMWGKEADIVKEWAFLQNELQLNHPIEDAFYNLANRVSIEEIRVFSEMFGLVKRTGGQVWKVIENVCDNMTASFETEEEIETIITAKKFEQKIMNVVPIVIILYLKMTSPDLLEMLYTTIAGRLVMTGCLLLYGISIIWAEKIITIQV